MSTVLEVYTGGLIVGGICAFFVLFMASLEADGRDMARLLLAAPPMVALWPVVAPVLLALGVVALWRVAEVPTPSLPRRAPKRPVDIDAEIARLEREVEIS